MLQGIAVDAERFGDRMQAQMEAYAPGFGDCVLARRVLTPADLEARALPRAPGPPLSVVW